MILFLSQTKDKCLCDFVNKFSKQTEIKTKLLTIKDIVNNGISIKYNIIMLNISSLYYEFVIFSYLLFLDIKPFCIIANSNIVFFHIKY